MVSFGLPLNNAGWPSGSDTGASKATTAASNGPPICSRPQVRLECDSVWEGTASLKPRKFAVCPQAPIEGDTLSGCFTVPVTDRALVFVHS
jgi:hypothetical protein